MKWQRRQWEKSSATLALKTKVCFIMDYLLYVGQIIFPENEQTQICKCHMLKQTWPYSIFTMVVGRSDSLSREKS